MVNCTECDKEIWYSAFQNTRSGRWVILPLEAKASGDFWMDENDLHETVDILGEPAGSYPVAYHESGGFIPHNPSHFLGHTHGG